MVPVMASFVARVGEGPNPKAMDAQQYDVDPLGSAANQRAVRKQLRDLDRKWTLSEVQQHRTRDDAWIAVDGRVYDIRCMAQILQGKGSQTRARQGLGRAKCCAASMLRGALQ